MPVMDAFRFSSSPWPSTGRSGPEVGTAASDFLSSSSRYGPAVPAGCCAGRLSQVAQGKKGSFKSLVNLFHFNKMGGLMSGFPSFSGGFWRNVRLQSEPSPFGPMRSEWAGLAGLIPQLPLPEGLACVTFTGSRPLRVLQNWHTPSGRGFVRIGPLPRHPRLTPRSYRSGKIHSASMFIAGSEPLAR